MGFRDEFVWGCATSSYQIEGAAYEDGKGLNVWDVFCKQDGKVFNQQSGDVACDHYHRFKEDVALMKQIGCQAYRFSINWARVLPNGVGQVNEEGIRFYDSLIDELLANGIEPYITLYHWELPYELQLKGGWLNKESPLWFYEYSKLISERFSGKVTKYFTLNEPQCFVGLSALKGVHAPGIILPQGDIFLMIHNVLKAHGLSVKALREYAKQDVKIGFAPTGPVPYPEVETDENIEAARKEFFKCNDDMTNFTWNVAWFADPVVFGAYPEDGMRKYAKYLPDMTKEDMKLISQPIDFFGQNIYNGHGVIASGDGAEYVERYDGFPRTSTSWPVTPRCIYWGARFLYERYQLPLYITENGVSCHDVVSLDGKVHDPNRIDFLWRYLKELKRAADDGVDIRGYFEWSLMDNFEWSEGYNERFGIVYVDYRTQERILKDSAYWYRDVIGSNGSLL